MSVNLPAFVDRNVNATSIADHQVIIVLGRFAQRYRHTPIDKRVFHVKRRLNRAKCAKWASDQLIRVSLLDEKRRSANLSGLVPRQKVLLRHFLSMTFRILC